MQISFHFHSPQLALKLTVKLEGVSLLARTTYGHLGPLQAPISAVEFCDRFAELFKNLNIPGSYPSACGLPSVLYEAGVHQVGLGSFQLAVAAFEFLDRFTKLFKNLNLTAITSPFPSVPSVSL